MKIMNPALLSTIAASVIFSFLGGCSSVARQLPKQVDNIAQAGGQQADDIAKTLSKQGDDAAIQLSKLREQANKCKQEFAKSAVREALKTARSSGSNPSYDNYLLEVARDAIQRCVIGKLGDKLLDEFAQSTVAEVKAEYQQGVSNDTGEVGSFPSGDFSNGTWLVSLRNENINYYYRGKNLNTGDSIELLSDRVSQYNNFMIYTWYNNNYQYQVVYDPSNYNEIVLRVVDPNGTEILKQLLHKV
ncbi:MAG TPA: hypothetical protein DEG17_25355 [Cyanobacteria bacterium UBA11149]|nr:hypothetical protein [Cyanobacteria bacterium UBA11367]HBE58811.1 hypothetical protein [Cyanobacteria bacterium UBA11366]HBK64399.1 hypothetical protein [Cyanobacteria bacterium UBA11166]HBR73411.1 hypothetical protein [Cyanobacteria bacterium UBA11159]HBS68121.1 hypothetical protein [Cyanobacteria bacterium UBA11153]HBW92104.1 hypothetical protein [Cyanobacteria bacterium UBA11149]HCA97351.1 hypothetical protein [Cyanobacteria bacterium UBA9226]